MAMRFTLGENAQMAFETLRTHKLRSFLTIVGIVIGIMAITAVSSIMVGLDRDIRGFLNDFGTNTIFVFKLPMGFRMGRLTPEERMRKPLTREDAEAIRESCPSVKNVAVEVFPRIGMGGFRRPSVRYRSHEVFEVEYSGTVPSYEQVYNARLARGRFFNEAEDLHRADVAVIGYDLADALFGAEEPLGKEILVGGVAYEVIGVLEKRKGQFFRDEHVDKVVLVPYRTYRKNNPQDDEHFIGAEAYPGKKAAAEDEIRTLLRRRRNVPFNKPDNFGISSAEQMANEFRQITAATALLIAVISSIGLLVGGVGVMNIMLMSVTERTREIGVRKAVGARRRDIIWQFLTEAMTLTGSGGVIGVALGIGISLLINATLPRLPSAVPLWGVLLGVGVSMSVGLFFGMYPAVKAARLDPVEALRYE
jgi:ABC-type antimicrobial peptide transport system permease subunit